MQVLLSSSIPLKLILLLVLGQSSVLGQDSADEATSVFLAAVRSGNVRTMLELLTEDSRAEAIGTADSLHGILVTMDTRALGDFFSGLGLIAAPDEVEHWESIDCLEILLISSSFDSIFAEPEEIDGIWKIDVKNGVFPRMLERLDIYGSGP